MNSPPDSPTGFLRRGTGKKDPKKPMANAGLLIMKSAIVKKFKLFDQNGDGFIDRSSLGAVLSSLDDKIWNEENLDKLMTGIDKKGTGKIRYEQFVDWTLDVGPEPLQQSFYYAVGAAEFKTDREKFLDQEKQRAAAPSPTRR